MRLILELTTEAGLKERVSVIEDEIAIDQVERSVTEACGFEYTQAGLWDALMDAAEQLARRGREARDWYERDRTERVEDEDGDTEG